MHYRDRARRRKNYNEPGHAHALTFTCFNRFEFLKAGRTCQWLADAINEFQCVKLDLPFGPMCSCLNMYTFVLWPRQKVYEIETIRKEIKEPVGRKAIKYIEENSPSWLARVTRPRGDRAWNASSGNQEEDSTTTSTNRKRFGK